LLEKVSESQSWMSIDSIENNLNLSVKSLRAYLSPVINMLPEWLKAYFDNQKISPHLFIVLMILKTKATNTLKSASMPPRLKSISQL